MVDTVEIVNTPPPVHNFISLRAACGWGQISEDIAVQSLAAGLLNATAYKDETVIGFVRVVGDGALYFYIQDLIVAKPYRGQGYGKILMRHILTQIEETVQSGATIALMAALGTEAFYENLGFITRPNADFGAGMIKVIN